jgi:DNA-binding transcriptional MerR regulator
MFTVGGFARASGVSAKVLRAYDAARLFVPAWVDPTSGYRYYSPAQLPEIRRILALRQVGMSLADIGSLVSGGADLRLALASRRLALEAEQREVERQLAALDIRVALADDGSPEPDVVVRHVPAEWVATFDLALQVDGDIGAAFYELESHVRDAGLRAHRPPGASFGPRAEGDGLAAEDLIFVPIRRPMTLTNRIGVRRLPACRVASILHRGPYETLGAALRVLEGWAAAAGYEPAGRTRILYLQFGAESELRVPRGWVVDRAADFMTELQLPIA